MTHYFKWFSITLVVLIVSMWAIIFFTPLPPLINGASHSRAVYDSHKKLLRLTLSQDGKYRLMLPLADIPPQLIAATLLQEDRYFYWHPGIDPFALVKAGWRTYVKGTRRIGASTITMQVARLRYGIHSKTLLGKTLQMIRALQIETHYRKDQILEAYLNLAPYGNNIEGIGAAALIYFDKSANQLTLPEILTLVVIPQNPLKHVANKDTLRLVRNKLYLRWTKEHPQDKNKKAMMELPLQMRHVHSLPFLAPHFVNNVLAHAPNNFFQINTTLDLKMQKLIERITQNYIARKNNLNVHNAAVLLVDTRGMGIKALLGSSNFFDPKISGQIDGTENKRSPGSTLKPFIYALAIDQGLIHPATVLKDVPHQFGNYNPENFDNDFMGPLKAKDALLLSRNIPAIYLANQLKRPSLYEFLQMASVHGLKAESYYGLALVLGSAEMSMQELAGMYAAFANDGIWRPLVFLTGAPQNPGKKIMSREASYLVIDMLQGTPSSEQNQLAAEQRLPLAWKTGTSSGYRDAWTIGLAGPYVLAVWIGNFNNQANPAFIGKQMAAPLFIEIANALNAQLGPLATFMKRPEQMNLTKVEICKASGMLPTRYCLEREFGWFVPGKSPIKTDTVYHEVAIDSQSGLRACHFDKNTRFEIYEFWSSDLLKIFKRAGIQRRLPPPYDPDCLMAAQNNPGPGPQIISPQPQVDYVTRINPMKPSWVPLTAIVDADVNNLYWFINETFIGKSPRDKSFLWRALPGKFVVRVVDDYGRADARDITIKLAK